MVSRNSADWPTISAFLVLILFAYYVLFYVSVVIGFADLTCERFIKINNNLLMTEFVIVLCAVRTGC